MSIAALGLSCTGTKPVEHPFRARLISQMELSTFALKSDLWEAKLTTQETKDRWDNDGSRGSRPGVTCTGGAWKAPMSSQYLLTTNCEPSHDEL